MTDLLGHVCRVKSFFTSLKFAHRWSSLYNIVAILGNAVSTDGIVLCMD
jgi:hypothetical protein